MRFRAIESTPGESERPAWVILAECAAGVVCAGLALVVIGGWSGALGGAEEAGRVAGIAAVVLLAILLLRQSSALLKASRAVRDEAGRARRDFLTGLPNRLAADAELESLVDAGRMMIAVPKAGANRGAIPIWYGAAYLAIDLDEFKPVNDECGHAEGDRLLQEVAHVLRSSAGEHDVVARIGGDEFSVLMKQRGEEEARSFGLSIGARLREHEFLSGGRRYPVSASMGMVRIAPGERTVEQIKSAADIGAYAAKESGRDALYEVGADGPVRVVATEPAKAEEALASKPVIGKIVSYRVVSLGACANELDRIEIAFDRRLAPAKTGQAHRHFEWLGAAGSMIDRDTPLSLVLPCVTGGAEIAALGRAVKRIAVRREWGTTLLFEAPRGRASASDMETAVRIVRGAGLRVGLVCRVHGLETLNLISALAPDEVQLHLQGAPKGTLARYTEAAKREGWQMSAAEVDDAETLRATAEAGAVRISGGLIGPCASPGETLRAMSERKGFPARKKAMPR